MAVADFLLGPLAWLLARRPAARWLLSRAQRTPYTTILGRDGSTYMERWWLFNGYDQPGFRAWLPSVRLHLIHRPDNDQHMHDHPWHARTFILDGWYVEERENGRRMRHPGSTASIKHGEFHRITSVCPTGVLTLFVTGRYRGPWGFKVPWREYVK